MLPEKPVVTLNLMKEACYLVHCEGDEAWPWNIVGRETRVTCLSILFNQRQGVPPPRGPSLTCSLEQTQAEPFGTHPSPVYRTCCSPGCQGRGSALQRSRSYHAQCSPPHPHTSWRGWGSTVNRLLEECIEGLSPMILTKVPRAPEVGAASSRMCTFQVRRSSIVGSSNCTSRQMGEQPRGSACQGGGSAQPTQELQHGFKTLPLLLSHQPFLYPEHQASSRHKTS